MRSPVVKCSGRPNIFASLSLNTKSEPAKYICFRSSIFHYVCLKFKHAVHRPFFFCENGRSGYVEVTQNLFHANDRRSCGEFEPIRVYFTQVSRCRLWSRRRCTSNPRNEVGIIGVRTRLVHNFMKRVVQSPILMILIIFPNFGS